MSWLHRKCLRTALRTPTLTPTLTWFSQIRKDAVRELVELAHADPDALSRDVLEAVGQRIKDRKVRNPDGANCQD